MQPYHFGLQHSHQREPSKRGKYICSVRIMHIPRLTTKKTHQTLPTPGRLSEFAFHSQFYRSVCLDQLSIVRSGWAQSLVCFLVGGTIRSLESVSRGKAVGCILHVLFRIPNPIFLTPCNSNLFQGFISILIPVVSNPVSVNPVFEITKRTSTTYGITQIIPHVIIV